MAQDFAGVDLGVAGDDDQFVAPQEPVPAWQRRSVVAGLFVFGLVVGVLGWQARVDNTVEIELVASGLGVLNRAEPADPALRHFGLNVYNAGQHDLNLVALELPGWEPAEPDARDETLRSGAWTTVDVTAAPTCDDAVPAEIVATIRHDSADVSVPLELPQVRESLGAYGEACAGVATPLTVTTLQDQQWLNARAQGSVVTEIRVAGSAADHAVIGVSATAAGLTGEAVEVPAPMLRGGRVDVMWEITECAAAENIGEVVFDVTIASVTGERTESVSLNEPYLMYVLANYVVREC